MLAEVRPEAVPHTQEISKFQQGAYLSCHSLFRIMRLIYAPVAASGNVSYAEMCTQLHVLYSIVDTQEAQTCLPTWRNAHNQYTCLQDTLRDSEQTAPDRTTSSPRWTCRHSCDFACKRSGYHGVPDNWARELHFCFLVVCCPLPGGSL